jgi:hypothetical protein
MKATRCLWTVGLFLAGATACWAAGQSSATSDGMNGAGASATAEGASPWGWMKLPKVTMPKISMPKVAMPKMPADPLAPVKSSAHKVSEGTKKAWEGTKEMFTFGGTKKAADSSSQTAEPSVWSRMFGGAEEPQPPQTVADFMAQKRVE